MLRDKIKSWVDANVWDGEDRSGCKCDRAVFDPDDLQELCDDLVEAAIKPVKVKPLVWGNRWENLDEWEVHCTSSITTIYIKGDLHNEDVWLYPSSTPAVLLTSLESAKQAAQEHYEKLILGSIEL